MKIKQLIVFILLTFFMMAVSGCTTHAWYESVRQSVMSACADAGKRPDGKKLTPIESNLLILWKGKPESDVVNVMGNPEFNQAGDSRFLRYTKYWEKDGFTAYNTNGQAIGGEIGGYAECFVEFKTKQDSNGEWRVEVDLCSAITHSIINRQYVQPMRISEL